MKAHVITVAMVNPVTMPEENQSAITYARGNRGPVPVFAVGAEVVGKQALHMVNHGMATPADEECRAACGLTDAELKERQVIYQAAMKGIKPEHMALFKAGVISGYDPDGKQLPGPHHDAYMKALEKTKKDEL